MICSELTQVVIDYAQMLQNKLELMNKDSGDAPGKLGDTCCSEIGRSSAFCVPQLSSQAQLGEERGAFNPGCGYFTGNFCFSLSASLFRAEPRMRNTSLEVLRLACHFWPVYTYAGLFRFARQCSSSQAVAWPNLATSCRHQGSTSISTSILHTKPGASAQLLSALALPRGLGTFAVAGGEADAPGARAHAGAGQANLSALPCLEPEGPKECPNP